MVLMLQWGFVAGAKINLLSEYWNIGSTIHTEVLMVSINIRGPARRIRGS